MNDLYLSLEIAVHVSSFDHDTTSLFAMANRRRKSKEKKNSSHEVMLLP
jgi:hypothetical protein